LLISAAAIAVLVATAWAARVWMHRPQRLLSQLRRAVESGDSVALLACLEPDLRASLAPLFVRIDQLRAARAEVAAQLRVRPGAEAAALSRDLGEPIVSTDLAHFLVVREGAPSSGVDWDRFLVRREGATAVFTGPDGRSFTARQWNGQWRVTSPPATRYAEGPDALALAVALVDIELSVLKDLRAGLRDGRYSRADVAAVCAELRAAKLLETLPDLGPQPAIR
jgi:hypothetical protein